MSRRRTVRIFRAVLRTSLVLLAAVLALWFLLPFPVDLLDRPPQSTVLLDRDGVPLRVFLAPGHVDHLWVRYDALGEWLPKAIVAAEDQRFWRHPGMDPLALARALRQNVTHLRRVSGASTISSQVIRLALPRARTPATKLREFFLATQMERDFSKTAILEQYLNRAPFGANLFGAESASRRYFGKRAADLTLAEAALLAGLPQSPTRHRPDLHPESARHRRDYVLNRMLATGAISPDQHAAARRAPLPKQLLPHAYAAPHFCDEVLRRARRRFSGELRTTLDLGLQREAEAALRDQLATMGDVHGGAIVVLDTATAEVLAMVGSPDVFDGLRAGQFNHALAWRSPGSALKPFAYALALDQGRITPASALADVPRQFTGYQPVNFDGAFRGIVSAREALVQSLNLPAIDLVRSCSPAAFHNLLSALGIASRVPRTEENLGVGAVLGNTDVRLLDVAAAYAALGRQGKPRAPTFAAWLPRGDAPAAAPVSPEAAWIVLDMLGGDERAVVETGHAADVPRRRVAWKTGTSAGFRDAWTFAVTPAHTVGVWIGNTDGRPSERLVGGAAAAPLAFGLLARFGVPAGAAAWFERPADVREVDVCAVSGARPNGDCPRCVSTWEIAGVSSPAICRVHQLGAGVAGVRTVREVWPPDVEAFLRREGLASTSAAVAPRVATPSPEEVFRLQPGRPRQQQLLALRASGQSPLHWYLDGTYLGSTADAAALPWEPVAGRHTVLCCDAEGRATAVRFQVE